MYQQAFNRVVGFSRSDKWIYQRLKYRSCSSDLQATILLTAVDVEPRQSLNTESKYLRGVEDFRKMCRISVLSSLCVDTVNSRELLISCAMFICT